LLWCGGGGGGGGGGAAPPPPPPPPGVALSTSIAIRTELSRFLNTIQVKDAHLVEW
jgi:hypothetical protein